MTSFRRLLLATTALGVLASSGPALAADASTTEAIKALQAQVNALQKQLSDMQTKEATRTAAAEAKPAAAPVDAKAEAKKEILPGVSVKPGGYVAMEGIYRTRNQATDTTSSLNTSIPFENDRRASQDEFRLSARSTRLSLLMEGKPDETMDLGAFVEIDFMASGGTTNETLVSGFAPRLRHAYATVGKKDWGTQFLAGQAFSLATLYKSGLAPRKEVGVVTIDSVGGPGYVYTRTAGVRAVKSFADNKMHVGLSLENPEVSTGGVTAPSSVSIAGAGSGAMAGANYSLDYAPDVIAKVAYDSSIGHFELFGLTRFFRSQSGTTNFQNHYATGFGGGVGAFVPLIDKKLELQANVLAGRGVARYSAAQLPDLAIKNSGDIEPVTTMHALVGLIGHPTPTWDLYLYAGAERAMRQDYGTNTNNFGYGSAQLDLSNCYTQSSSATCLAQTRQVLMVSPGFWNTVYKGDYGTMKVGAQYSLTRRDAFSGLNDKTPHALENTVMTSFRYSPF